MGEGGKGVIEGLRGRGLVEVNGNTLRVEEVVWEYCLSLKVRYVV